MYFDNHKTRLTPSTSWPAARCRRASRRCEIDGQWFWDGGIVSNSPLWYVLDEAPGLDALIMQIDLFSARGTLPTSLDEVQERAKDIQYSSKTRFNTDRCTSASSCSAAFRRLARQAAGGAARRRGREDAVAGRSGRARSRWCT